MNTRNETVSSDRKRKRDASIGSNNPLPNLTKPNLNFKNLKR